MKRIILCFIVLLFFSIMSVMYAGGKAETDVTKVIIEEETSNSYLDVINIYFPRLPDMKFVGQKIKFTEDLSIEEKIRIVMNELKDGPKDRNLISVIPDGSIINKVKVKGNIVYIDFSKEFVENHPGGSMGEYNTIYSIVNSLTEIEGINAVDFSIEGEKLETYKGHCEFNEAVYRDESNNLSESVH